MNRDKRSYQLSHIYSITNYLPQRHQFCRRTEVNHIIPKKATAVTETSATIIN